jgi:hypothetical protein
MTYLGKTCEFGLTAPDSQDLTVDLGVVVCEFKH